MQKRGDFLRFPDRRLIYFVLFAFFGGFAYVIYFFVLNNKAIDISVRAIVIMMFVTSGIIGTILVFWSESLRREQNISTRSLLNLRNMLLEMLSVNDTTAQQEIIVKYISKGFDPVSISVTEETNGKSKLILDRTFKRVSDEVDLKTNKIEFDVLGKKYRLEMKRLRELSKAESFTFDNSIRIAQKIVEDTAKINLKERELQEKIAVNEKYRDLYKFITEINTRYDSGQIYWAIPAKAKALFNASAASVLDVSGSQESWRFIAFKDVDNKSVIETQNKLQQGIGGTHILEVKNTKRANYINNVKDHPGWIASNERVKSWIGIPILIENEVSAIICIDRDQPDEFKEEDLDLATAFSTNISMVLDKLRLIEDFKRLAITDPLTELHNRRSFDESLLRQIEQEKRYRTGLVVMEMDLDNFKKINDKYGHAEGDRLLKAFAHVLRNSIRQSDLAFRIGGDEFAIVLPNMRIEDAYEVALRIQKKTREIRLNIDIKPTVSIGLKQYDEGTYQEFFEKVDKALYEAKNSDAIKIVIG